MVNKYRFFKWIPVAVLVAALLCACGKTPAETTPAQTVPAAVPAQTEPAPVETEPEKVILTVEGTEEQADLVLVKTSFCNVKYPFAFADLIRVKAQDEGNVATLEFSACITDVEYPMYVLRFGGSEGILLGTLTIPGEAAPREVYAEFCQADTAALGDHVGTFYAAQETFNDVVASLAENGGFTPAQ